MTNELKDPLDDIDAAIAHVAAQDAERKRMQNHAKIEEINKKSSPLHDDFDGRSASPFARSIPTSKSSIPPMPGTSFSSAPTELAEKNAKTAENIADIAERLAFGLVGFTPSRRDPVSASGEPAFMMQTLRIADIRTVEAFDRIAEALNEIRSALELS